MADLYTLRFYYHTQTNVNWTSGDNLVDGVGTTYASRVVPGSTWPTPETANYIQVDGIKPTIDDPGPTIYTVKFIIRTYYSSSGPTLFCLPNVNGSDYASPNTIFLTGTPGDQTITISSPLGGWTWEALASLKLKFYCTNTDASSRTVYLSLYYVQVETYCSRFNFRFYDGSEAGSNWTDDSKFWDEEDLTYAYRDVPASSGEETTKWIQCDSCDAPQESDLKILYVNLYTYGYHESADLVPYGTVSFDDSTGSEITLTPGSGASGSGNYYSILRLNAFPDIEQTWSWNSIYTMVSKYWYKNNNTSNAYEARFKYAYVTVYTSLSPNDSDTPTGTYGLEVFDSSGNKTLSITDRLTRLLYSGTQTSTGTVTVSGALPAGSSSNDVFAIAIALDNTKIPFSLSTPTVDINSGDVSVVLSKKNVCSSYDPYGDTHLMIFGW